jgi:two-component system response regulator DctR
MTSCVHIIDDDEAIRDSLTWLMSSCGLPSRSYVSAEAFLAEALLAGGGLRAEGVVVLDIRMGCMSGLELFDRFRAEGARLPVIFLTGHGDVPMAVEAIKAGAYDFVEKPCDDQAFVALIRRALAEDQRRRAEDSVWSAHMARLRSLSEREREVMERLVQGKLNKVIAAELGVAVRTVEVHRARVLAKMGVRTAVELAAIIAGQKK